MLFVLFALFGVVFIPFFFPPFFFFLFFFFLAECRLACICRPNSSCCNGTLYISSRTKVAKNVRALEKGPGNKEAKYYPVFQIPQR